jgi:alpha-tubulin suppressor-like RCC1 family protein
MAAQTQTIICIGTNGNTQHGQCFFPEAEGPITVPTAALLEWLPDGMSVPQVAAGENFTLLIADNNQLFAVGDNDEGQLGRGHMLNNDDPNTRDPRPVTGIILGRITQIAAGFCHCAVVTEGGKLFMWGLDNHGQCGTGPEHEDSNVLAATCCNTGALAGADVRVVFVACGGDHTVALTSDGGAIAFGSNGCGQLGTGNNSFQPAPVLLMCAALDGVHIVGCAAGGSFTQLVSDDGRVFAMGENDNGQLGTGDTTNVNTPTEIDAAHFGGAPVAAVACGFSHAMAITRDEGKLYCWGEGEYGATGLGHTDDATTPQPVMGVLAGERAVRIAACAGHSCALTEDGRVFAFGECNGIPAPCRQGIPQLLQEGALAGGTTVCALSAGCYSEHTIFLSGSPPAEPGFDTAALPAPAPIPLTNVERDLAALLDSGECADVTFRVGGEEIVAHRLILTMRSPVFKAMLAWGGQPAAAAASSSDGGSGATAIEVEGVEPAVFRQLLRWLYTGQCEEGAIDAMADHLFEAAAKFSVDDLQALASRTMVAALNAEKLCDYFALAHAHDDEELKAACAALVAKDMAAVVQTEGWARLGKERPQLAVTLMESMAAEAAAGGGAQGQKRKRRQ